MDIKEIRRLVKLMVDNDLRELNIADGEQSVHLKRGAEIERIAVAPSAPPAAEAPAAPSAPEAGFEAPEENLLEIRSPMVGTFFSASSPDSDPYVSVGDAVSDDTVVCIIEAMKVMNEIKAECSGTIAEVCVDNAQAVEYGQVIFRVRPA
ncbi:MAG: acetyl-CoA carboxylase biotin carboxyl carrier protein [Phycisphaerae bacterium]|nr:acetyl-CoA carboxylase biotin carboxyl carrier protein [Phycisphaerae bacterium]